MRSLTANEVEWVSGGAEASVAVGPVKVEASGDTKNFGQALINLRVSEILCERHTMMLPRSMYATQEEDAGGHAGH